MIKYTAIVLAAGQGKRMGAGHNKQFININDKPLVLHTLAVFERDTWCEEIILVTNEQEREQMEALLERFPSSTPIRAVDGGAERQDSVYEGLSAVRHQTFPVLIHDGARPFVMEESLPYIGRNGCR